MPYSVKAVTSRLPVSRTQLCSNRFGLVEKPKLVGIGLFRACSKALVGREPKLLLKPFDLQSLDTKARRD